MAKRAWAGPPYRRVAQHEVQAPRLQGLSRLELLVWLEARVGRQSTRLGLGRFSPALCAEDLGVDVAGVIQALTELCSVLNWRFDQQARWLLIPEALPAAWDGSPDQIAGYRREAERDNPPPALLEAWSRLVSTLTPDHHEDHGGDLPPDHHEDHGGDSTRTRTRTRISTPAAPQAPQRSRSALAVVPPERANWRTECADLGHEPRCQSPGQHEIRKIVAAGGCQHPGVCPSIEGHKKRIALEGTAVEATCA